jgi:hypothetical protein
MTLANSSRRVNLSYNHDVQPHVHAANLHCRLVNDFGSTAASEHDCWIMRLLAANTIN